MSLYSTEQRQFGIKKESSRGTAEAAPAKWYPVDKDTSLDYKLNLIDDKALRGIAEEFPPNLGTTMGSGKIKMPLDAQSIGEFLVSLLGAPTSAQQAATIAYKHTFLRATTIQRTGYTFFMDYGISVKKYNLGTVKKLTLTGPTDGIVMADMDVLFKTEATGAIGTPAFPTNQYLGFNGVSVKIGGSIDSDIKDWTLNIDNGAAAHRTLSQSQDISDILVKGRMNISGNFKIYFQSETERAKFLAGTSQNLRFLCEGATIASTYKYTVDVYLPKIYYKAYPLADLDGLLGATVEFDAKYDTSTTKAISVDLTNADVSY
ncbi:MAG: hypothetical protein DMF62_02455 [Acidobacteria bacterium]|nr:MAG: hypothetical protein DMF62_02455 [Acidobacteriota bacterium]